MMSWWSQLNERERRLVGIGGPLLLLAIIYWGAWTPFQQHVQEVERQLASQRNTLAWMAQKGGEIRQLQSSGGNRVDLSMTLEAVVNLTSHQLGLTLTRLQPMDKELLVEIDQVEFERLVNWLVVMERDYGVGVKVIEIGPEGERKGTVKIRRLQVGRDK